MKIKLLQIREAKGESITSPLAVVRLMKEEAKADRECVWVLHLNTKHMVIEKEIVSIGTLNSSVIAPREVFKRAILNSAYAIIMVHNHPSGDPYPSLSDEQTIIQLGHAGYILGISLLDYIIISPSGAYWSARERGYMDHLKEYEFLVRYLLGEL